MTPRPFSHPLLAKLRSFALITLIACPSCAMAEKPGSSVTKRNSGERRELQATAQPKATPTPFRRPKNGRPDPRYRPATSFAELQAVAGEVAKATGRKIHWRLVVGSEKSSLATIRGGLENCTITIHPVAAKKVPPNTWAFIFGHEFAHLVEELGTHSATNPANELKADIAGARYAMAAGYRVEAFLGWVLTEPNQQTDSHGSLQARVKAISARYGIPENTVQAEAKRATKYRATH